MVQLTAKGPGQAASSVAQRVHPTEEGAQATGRGRDHPRRRDTSGMFPHGSRWLQGRGGASPTGLPWGRSAGQPLLSLQKPRGCRWGGHARRTALRAPLTLAAEIPVVKHFLTVGVQGPVVPLPCTTTEKKGLGLFVFLKRNHFLQTAGSHPSQRPSILRQSLCLDWRDIPKEEAALT